MPKLAKRNFTGGELDPALHNNVDLVKYLTGLKTLRNFWSKRSGGVQNRPGFEYCGFVKNRTKTTRLIPFIFNNEQAYVVELGEYYIRFIVDGEYIKEAAKNITGITQAAEGVVTSNAHGYSNGDHVYLSGIVGMTELNGRTVVVSDVTANTFKMKDQFGAYVATSGYAAYSSAGTAEKIYTLPSAYEEAVLRELNYTQSADVMTVVHENHAVQEITRLTSTTFSLADKTFGSLMQLGSETGYITSGGAGAGTFRYKVTAINEDGQESLTYPEYSLPISNITQANPAVVTHAAHALAQRDYVSGDVVYIDNVIGMTEVNGRYFTITPLTNTTFQLNGIDSTGYTAYVGSGEVNRTWFGCKNTLSPTSANPIVPRWDTIATAARYTVYADKTGSGIFGYVATVDHRDGVSYLEYPDIGVEPDYTDTPPEEYNPFNSVYNYPRAVGYTQQRLLLGGTDNEPETIWTSRTGQYNNFNRSFPLRDDDSIKFTLQGKNVSRVNHLLELNKMLIFTTGGEWSLEGGSDGTITPSIINAKQQTYNGSTRVAPVIVDGSVLYVQARGSIIRDLGYTFEADGYRGNDITIFSAHLFEGYTILDMAYQQNPHSIAWVLRSDGVLLGCTYIKEQQILAWHRHDTDGEVKSICVIPEGSEDALYAVIKRTLTDGEVRYTERLSSRSITDQRDMTFLDSFATYDGRNTTATTMTLSGGTTWDNESLTLTASASFFKSSDVGNVIQFTGADDGIRLDCEITAYTSATVVTVTPSRLVPTDLRTTATTTWAKAVDQIGGLHHLIGKQVTIFGDAQVLANPNNSYYETFTVDSHGNIELDDCYAVVHVGLPYLPDFETLDIDTTNSETLLGRKKIVNSVTFKLRKSRGVWVGPVAPEEDDKNTENSKTYGLTEMKLRQGEHYYDPNSLFSGEKEIAIKSKFSTGGRVFVRQIDPLPIEISTIAPSGTFQEG